MDKTFTGEAKNHPTSPITKLLLSHHRIEGWCVMTTLAHMSIAMIRILSPEHTFFDREQMLSLAVNMLIDD